MASNYDYAGNAVTTASLAALGPVGWGVAAVNLAAGLYGGHSARKQRRRMKAELERRRVGLIESKNMAIGRVAEGTAAAKGPLEAIAERVRTEEGFRDPVLEQSLVAGSRQQLGAQLHQVQANQTGASMGIPQQQLMMAALMSQVQSSTLGRQLARRMESTRALTGIYSQLSEITQAGAQSAAGIETQFAGMAQGAQLMNEEGSDPLAAGLGGLLSYFGTDEGKEGLAALFSRANGEGSDATAPEIAQGMARKTPPGAGWVTNKYAKPWWNDLMSYGSDATA